MADNIITKPQTIKELFAISDTKKFVSPTTPEQLGKDIESFEYVRAYKKVENEFLPHVDFSTASNFAIFGSAKKYYDDAFGRILYEYPYDGSKKEKLHFDISSSYLDKYIFDKVYPRTNGYITFAVQRDGVDATSGGATSSFGFYQTDTHEYIFLEGGPHAAPSGSSRVQESSIVYDHKSNITSSKANIYDESKNRTSNLAWNFGSGSTVEFFMKKGTWAGGIASQLQEHAASEMIFDIWNSGSFTSALSDGYARFSVYINSDNVDKVYFHARSGSTVINPMPLDTGLDDIADDKWHHYALTAENSGSSLVAKLYVDGACTATSASADDIMGPITGAFRATIGATVEKLYGDNTGSVGWGKLSGSLDEFRFWKTRRDAKQIGRFFREQVGGGTNTDPANTDLAVYYKFNEGITQTASIDSRILDYSGRITNGDWVGYVGETATNGPQRFTGSAMVEQEISKFEFKDPILYGFHPDVSSSLTSLKLSGEEHDFNNTNSLIAMFPAWMREQDEEVGNDELQNLVQIVASYLDTLFLQMQSLPRLKDVAYHSASYKPYPFNQRLLESHGFDTDILFNDITALESLRNRDEQIKFEEKLYDIKNSIYQNVYNNLVHINKSKGTEKSFRNLIRCFGIDDELIRLNTYAKNATHTIKNNYRETSLKKTFANFYDNNSAVVYQFYEAGEEESVSYLTGAALTPITVESEVYFPKYPNERSNFYRPFASVTSSLFGMHSIVSGTAGSVNLWESPDSASMQVYAIRPKSESPDAYFLLTGTLFPSLESPIYENVYDGNKWNFAVKIRQHKDPFANYVTGAYSGSKVNVEFYGVQAQGSHTVNEFSATGAMEHKTFLGKAGYQNIFTDKKAAYMGAHRQDFTGSVLTSADTYISTVRLWLNNLDNEVIKAHAMDATNYGTANPYRNAFLFEKHTPKISGSEGPPRSEIPEASTLAMHWCLDTLTSSNASGQFVVPDCSSGSAYPVRGSLQEILNSKLTGLGVGFKAGNTGSLAQIYLSNAKQIPPDNINSSDMVNVLEFDDEVFTRETRPIDYFFAFEKSMYQNISDEMLNLFATIRDFNNLIGDPVNRYRYDYKQMGKIRRFFFDRVGNTPDLDKFIEFYRWFDSSLSTMLTNLIPATADFSSDIRTVVESHALERNKIQSKFQHLKKFIPPKEIPFGMTHKDPVNVDTLNWDPQVALILLGSTAGNSRASFKGLQFGEQTKTHIAPVSAKGALHATASTTDNYLWWKERASRTVGTLASGDSDVNDNRQGIVTVLTTETTASEGDVINIPSFARANSRQYRFVVNNQLSYDLHQPTRKYDFYRNLLQLKGSGHQPSVFIDGPDVMPLREYSIDPQIDELTKIKFHIKPTIGTTAFANSNDDIKASLLPFGIYSSSLPNSASNYIKGTLGYIKLGNEKQIDNFEINDLHKDVYEGDIQQPLQGPFTEQWVGGHQGRHDNLTLDDTIGAAKRAESWHLDIDHVNHNFTIKARNEVASALPTARFMRDEYAKRPVNLKNIQQTTASSYNGTTVNRTSIGNYTYNYEVVSSVGRNVNNMWFRRNDGDVKQATAENAVLLQTPNATQRGVISNITDRLDSVLNTAGTIQGNNSEVPDRDIYLSGTLSKNKTIIVDRFSAPGGYEVMSRGFLDPTSETFSVYNSMNYRNLSARNKLLADHTSSMTSGSSPNPHQVSRNTNYRLAVDTTVRHDETYNTYLTTSKADNFFVNHLIPQSDRQYRWFSSSLRTHQRGEAMPFGFMSSSGDYDSVLSGTATPPSSSVYQDFVGLNKFILTSVSSSDNTLHAFDDTAIEIAEDVSDEIYNAYYLQLNGPYGHPSWKQMRAGENAVTRYHKKNNILSVLDPSKPKLDKYGLMPGKYEGAYGDSPDGTQDRGIISYTEPSVTSRYRPMLTNLQINRNDFITVQHSYGNNLGYFANPGLNYAANVSHINNEGPLEEQPYTELLALYKFKEFDPGPINSLGSIVYTEQIYPREVNSFLNRTRFRDSYAEPAGSGSDEQRRPEYGYDAIFHRKFWANTEAGRYRSVGALNSQGYPQNKAEQLFASASALVSGAYMRMFPTADDFDESQSHDEDYFNNSSKPALNIWPLFGNTTASYTAGTPVQNYIANIYINFGSTEDGELWRGPGVINAQSSSDVAGNVFGVETLGINHTSSVIFPVFGVLTASIKYHGTDNKLMQMHSASTFGQAAVTDSSTGSNEVNWKVHKEAGVNPWYDSYTEYAEELRPMAKDYSVLPEFRISDHLKYYFKTGSNPSNNNIDAPGANGNFLVKNNKFLTLEGATLSSSADTENADLDETFMERYATSDFLKHFDTVFEDHKGKNSISRFTFRVSGIKKLLPYYGFYPVLRTVQMASLLSQSYGDHIGGMHSSSMYPREVEAGKLQSFLSPLYAPGIMYNTIKAGLAVDYPVYTGSFPQPIGAGGSYRSFIINAAPNYRLPFETILDLSNIPLSSSAGNNKIYWACNASVGETFFDYNGNKNDDLYSLAANNFFAEVPNFFLRDHKLKSFKSKQRGEIGTFDPQKVYYMDVDLFISNQGSASLAPHFSASSDFIPSISPSNPNEFIMAEGMRSPRGEINFGADHSLLAWNHTVNLRGQIYGPAVRYYTTGSLKNDDATASGSFGNGGHGFFQGMDRADPAYAPYTPPYFYGMATARISFKPDPLNPDPKMDEIISACRFSASYSNDLVNLPNYVTGGHKIRDVISADSFALRTQMQVSSSINLFGKVTDPKVKLNADGSIKELQDAEDISNFERWVISPKFECPVLNFSASEATSDYFHKGTARGMWNGYGKIPNYKSDGVFLRLRESFPEVVGSAQEQHTASLLTKMFGGSDRQLAMGELAEDYETTLSEAIAMIPYVENYDPANENSFTAVEGMKRFFFKIDENMFFKQAQNIKSGLPAVVATDHGLEKDIQGTSMSSLAEKMERFILPPKFDFMRNKGQVTPFAMYIFEFSHKLTRKELSNIWQGVMPEIATSAKKEDIIIDHPVNQFEIFGNQLKSFKRFPRVKWMIFKIKRRANSDYYAVTEDSQDDFKFLKSLNREQKYKYSYNWPYDYCSLVELAKIECAVEMSRFQK